MPMQDLKKFNFDRDVPRVARVAELAPILNKAFEEFDSMSEDTEAFDADVIATISSAGLMDFGVTVKVKGIAIHPDNRETSMIVPIDSHDLLFRMFHDGFSYSRWRAFGCRVPADPAVMRAWVQENLSLVAQSDGLLAPLLPEDIEVFAARGSHGSTGLRCLLEGATAVYPDMAGSDGKLSAAKVIAAKPSFARPLQEGVPFDLVPGELCIAVPRLMEVLSRIGNNANNVFREQSALQHCNRLHRLAVLKEKSGPMTSDSWDQIARQACIGMGQEFIDDAKKLCKFVKAWSGGEDGKVLNILEAYEKTLVAKRKLVPADLAAIAGLDLWQCQRFGIMMVKAMLNAPTCDSTGHARLFSTSDFASVQQKGKNCKLAIEACELVQKFETFLQAYMSSAVSDIQKQKLISTMEVRLAMHVFRKTAANRASYSSLVHVAEAAYNEAKALHPHLPKWGVIKGLSAQAEEASASGSIRELNLDGTISDSILKQKGFTIGKKLARNDDLHTPFVLRAFHANQETVVLELFLEEGEKEDEEHNEEKQVPETLEISRSSLLKSWQLYVQAPNIFLTEVQDPTQHCDIITDVVKGAVKQAMTLEFFKSSEQHVFLRTSPQLGVFASKGFTAPGNFKLVCLSSALMVVEKPPVGHSAHHFLGSVGTWQVYARNSLVLPKPGRTSFVSKFWACQALADQRQANACLDTITVNIKVCKETHEMKIPIITNTTAIKVNDEIICLKAETDDEPAAKLARNLTTHKGGKGKGKGKSKGKTNSK